MRDRARVVCVSSPELCRTDYVLVVAIRAWVGWFVLCGWLRRALVLRLGVGVCRWAGVGVAYLVVVGAP